MSDAGDETRTVAPDGRPAHVQPAWRQDFPIDWPQDHYVARRDFTKFLGLTSLAFVVGQLWIGVKSLLGKGRTPGPKPIARLGEIPIGGSLMFRYPEDPDICLLLRPAADQLLAYNQKCTHLSCAVIPELAKGRLHCPCHHGYFDAQSGRPLAGPPRRPLPRITLEVRDGWVYATGVEVTAV